jgi:hypothetical protein
MPVIVPLDIITTSTITSFEIDSIEVRLFSSATIRVNVFSGNYRTDVRNIIIEGDDYVNWGNDDQYINNYVATVLGFTIADTPISQPSDAPISEPSEEPSNTPISEPSEQPSEEPSNTPISEPSEQPSEEPSDAPISEPSEEPSDQKM